MAQEILFLCMKVWHFQTESVVLTISPVVESYMRPLPSAENVSLACGSGAHSNALKQNKRNGCNNFFMEKS